jgi:acyl-CoA synthetase (AMP-forming)/AMP-acid ligase II
LARQRRRDSPVLDRRYASLVEVLEERATERPDKKAFVFVPERGEADVLLTFAELQHRVHAAAARIAQHTAKGDRAVLLFPTGLDFIVAFFGCLAAGVIAVPLMVPRRSARDSAGAIITECKPRIALTTNEVLETRGDVAERCGDRGLCLIPVSATDCTEAGRHVCLPLISQEDVALLQYTSGSTSTPKGVVVRHRNMLASLEMIRLAMSNTEHSTCVGWVPLYHDMGLMMGVIQPVHLGATSVLMSPAGFMQRPLKWLRTIHRYRAEVTSAPNFAFDLCVARFDAGQMDGTDLSCWKLALNGAEPVRADTIARFTETFARYGFGVGTMYPGYGLAEATLLVSGGMRGTEPITRRVSRSALQNGEIAEPATADDAQSLVSCGRSVVGQQIAIVDPATRGRLPANRVGEIWVSGPNVTDGYWENAAATQETFKAVITGTADPDWLCTGDLGFLDDDGQLFITGRLKDVIIIRGLNHYPQDIERTVQDSHPALRRDCGAAFAVMDETDGEKLVIVQEIERTQRRETGLEVISRCVREAVTRQHEIAVQTIVLISPGSLPKTTSGKIQRGLAKRLWLGGGLSVLGQA